MHGGRGGFHPEPRFFFFFSFCGFRFPANWKLFITPQLSAKGRNGRKIRGMILPLRGDYEVQHETGGKYTGSLKAPVNRDDVHHKSIRLVARNAENAICCKLCVWNNLRSSFLLLAAVGAVSWAIISFSCRNRQAKRTRTEGEGEGGRCCCCS